MSESINHDQGDRDRDRNVTEFRSTTVELFHRLNEDFKLVNQATVIAGTKIAALADTVSQIQTILVNDTRNSIVSRIVRLEHQLEYLIAQVDKNQGAVTADKQTFDKELDVFRSDLAALTQQLKQQGITAPTPQSSKQEATSTIDSLIKLLSDPTVRTILIPTLLAILTSLGFSVAKEEGAIPGVTPSAPSSPSGSPSGQINDIHYAIVRQNLINQSTGFKL